MNFCVIASPHFGLLDWSIIGAVLLASLLIGLYAMRKSGQTTEGYFLSGRSMPWWLLGTSMVATTFAVDTPNFVTETVRRDGVSGNWIWWAFIISAMLTTFVFARLWRRSEVLTDNEFYELRYSGRPASLLRAFRSLYLGLVFNTIIMANVNLAAMKFGSVLLGIPPWQTLLIGSGVTLIYASLGGLRGILMTDFMQFIVAMIGSVAACIFIVNLPEVGGLEALLMRPEVMEKQAMFPDFSNWDLLVPLFLMPLMVVWWSSYYPGAEPGGGGYVAQRMLAAKSEGHALGATFLFNIAHYALRPWPWILIALASLAVYPSTASIEAALPAESKHLAMDDMAYPLMIARLPSGLLGLVAASLVAAYMSTISTQLNIGSSYLTHDFYHRFLKPQASERHLVWVGRILSVVIVSLAAMVSFWLESAATAFRLMLLVGAGSGAIYLLRWLWWRVNATAEIAAMVVSFCAAAILLFGAKEMVGWLQTLIVTGLTTLAWLVGCFFGPPTDEKTLRNFAQKIRPPGPGWKNYVPAEKGGGDLVMRLVATVMGVMAVLALLLGTGYLIYSRFVLCSVCFLISAATFYWLWKMRKQL